jgi:hypothetical protein
MKAQEKQSMALHRHKHDDHIMRVQAEYLMNSVLCYR